MVSNFCKTFCGTIWSFPNFSTHSRYEIIWKTLSHINSYFQVQPRKVEAAKARMACPPIWGSLEQPPTITLTKCFRQPLNCSRVWTQQLVVSQSLPEKPREPPACQLSMRPKMVSPTNFLEKKANLCSCNPHLQLHLASKFRTLIQNHNSSASAKYYPLTTAWAHNTLLRRYRTKKGAPE